MRSIKYLLILLLLTNCKNNNEKKFDSETIKIVENTTIESDEITQTSIDGVWEWVYNPNNEDLPDMVFTLNVEKVKNNEFVAQYCAVAQKGNRIDCSTDVEYNVRGVIVNNKVEASFYSFFDSKKVKGKVELLIENNNLKWNIIKEPNSEYYVPKECILFKKTGKKTQNSKELNQSNSLPFNFADRNNENYKVYTDKDLPEINEIINTQINEFPMSIFIIDNGNMPFQTYIIETDGDSVTQILVNIENNKVISHEIIGYESDYEYTFIMNKSLTVDMYKVNKDESRLLIKKIQINKDGTISEKK